MMRLALWLSAAAVCSLTLASCTKKTTVSAQPVFSVNKRQMTAGDFSKLLAKRMKNFDALAARDPANITRIKNEILRDFLVRSLIDDYCEAKNIVVLPGELDAELKKAQAQYPNDLTFKASLMGENLSHQDWKTSIRAMLLQRKFFENLRTTIPAPSPEQVKAYFDKNPAEFNLPPQLRIQQILVGKQEEADLLRSEIRKGRDFGQIAEKYSLSPDAAQKGIVNFVTKGTVPAFDRAFQMRIGEVSSIIKSNYGYHIIKLLEKRPATVISYAKATPSIRLKLLAEAEDRAFAMWLEEATRKARVEKNDALIEQIRVQTQGTND